MPPAAGTAQGNMGAEQWCCLSSGHPVGSGVPAQCQLVPQEKNSSILRLLLPAAISLPAAAFKPSQATTPITAGNLRWPWPRRFTSPQPQLPGGLLPRVSPGCPAGRRQSPTTGTLCPALPGGALPAPVSACAHAGGSSAGAQPVLGRSQCWDMAGAGVTGGLMSPQAMGHG